MMIPQGVRHPIRAILRWLEVSGVLPLNPKISLLVTFNCAPPFVVWLHCTFKGCIILFQQGETIQCMRSIILVLHKGEGGTCGTKFSGHSLHSHTEEWQCSASGAFQTFHKQQCFSLCTGDKLLCLLSLPYTLRWGLRPPTVPQNHTQLKWVKEQFALSW